MIESTFIDPNGKSTRTTRVDSNFKTEKFQNLSKKREGTILAIRKMISTASCFPLVTPSERKYSVWGGLKRKLTIPLSGATGPGGAVETDFSTRLKNQTVPGNGGRVLSRLNITPEVMRKE